MNRRSFIKLGAMTAAAMSVPSVLVPRETLPAVEPLGCATGISALREQALGDSLMWRTFAAFDFGYPEPFRNAIILDLHCPQDVMVAIPKGDVARLNAPFQALWAEIEREAWPVRRF